jgi:hypothetical protein
LSHILVFKSYIEVLERELEDETSVFSADEMKMPLIMYAYLAHWLMELAEGSWEEEASKTITVTKKVINGLEFDFRKQKKMQNL